MNKYKDIDDIFIDILKDLGYKGSLFRLSYYIKKGKQDNWEYVEKYIESFDIYPTFKIEGDVNNGFYIDRPSMTLEKI